VTSTTSSHALHLSKVALQVATEASRLVLESFRKQHQVRLKSGGEPVTEVDERSEALVRERLRELTPDIPVVGEEAGGKGGRELTWYCDPIDGTVNFMRGHPHFAVSLGLADAGGPIAGAVVAPALRLWWRGSVGDRAFRNEAPCLTSDTSDLAEALVTTGLPTRASTLVGSRLDLLGRIATRVRDVRRCGSAAIELCMVADGTYDAYVSPRLNPWDTCAGAAILLAAGGRFALVSAPPTEGSGSDGALATGELEIGHNGPIGGVLGGALGVSDLR
jgi:myo-inositol-1(or 4)-monophosphatase